jgi:hypothetical protein
LGTRETLELLERLRATAREFADRQARLEHQFRTQSAAEDRASEAALRRETARLNDALAAAETAHQTDRTRCAARFEVRKKRIVRAHDSCRRQAVKAVEDEEGRRRYVIQKQTLEAERRRETELAAATTAWNELQQRVADSRAEFAPLEAAAQRAFRGFSEFRRLLTATPRVPETELAPEEDKLLGVLEGLQVRIATGLEGFRKFWLARGFQHASLGLLLVALLVGHAGLFLLAPHLGLTAQQVIASFLVLLIVVLGAHNVGQRRAQPAATAVAHDLLRARRLHEVCLEKGAARWEQAQIRIQTEYLTTRTRLDQEWKDAVQTAELDRQVRPLAVDDQAARATARSERLHQARASAIERSHPETLAGLRRDSEIRIRQHRDAQAAKLASLSAAHQRLRQALEEEWERTVQPLSEALAAAQAAAQTLFPDWSAPGWAKWTPPAQFANAVPFARLELELDRLAGGAPDGSQISIPLASLLLPQDLQNPPSAQGLLTPARSASDGERVPAGRVGADPPLASQAGAASLPGPLSLPLLLTFPHQGSILFETGTTGRETAIAALNNILFRLLSTTPPGKLNFTILDPVGLGQGFAGLMHLADYEESHINSRIWTQTAQIEERLAELNEHMEKVIQMYLRNEYATIAEYNAEAGTIAEKYHFLVVADFPVNFSEIAARRLINIATSGARCGVFTLIHWDRRHAPPHDFVPDQLRQHSVCLNATDAGFAVAGHAATGMRLVLDPPPAPELATQLLHEVGRSSKDANRVEVPFTQVTPSDAELWSRETAEELRVPIGRAGATKLQYLAIGRGTRQHALIAGKTGSGKSTLFHVIITNLALWCSPEQVEFYLVDFKKGVEFKCYATQRLPHARVVAIESDRQFGLSVLERVDQELRRRGDLFRQLGAQDLAGYQRAGGREPLPRTLLIIDEFQEFFVEEDRISQSAALLLDRIVRQGRAFGIHVLLGSQTLGGAYSLARATIGQMVIRIALQCNEADAYLIMDENNAAPRLLSRPGEGIYNDAAGALEGNSPFQTVWLSDDVRNQCLDRVQARARRSGINYAGPIVFEGNAPADVRENALLQAVLDQAPRQPALAARAWLGAPNSIKGPTEVVFQRQTGHNLLVVGQRDESALALLAVTLVSLAAQYPPGTARFVLLDSSAPATPAHEFLERLLRAVPRQVERPKAGELAATMHQLAAAMHGRGGETPSADRLATFLLIHGLQNFKKLRQEDEFSFSSGDAASASPGAQLVTLLSDGPSLGLHVIATCDAYSNVARFLGRKALGECALRVLFQMSASDSASLMDDPAAGALGMHRALFYHEQEGHTETFRPYALPGDDWLDEVAKKLAQTRA